MKEEAKLPEIPEPQKIKIESRKGKATMDLQNRKRESQVQGGGERHKHANHVIKITDGTIQSHMKQMHKEGEEAYVTWLELHAKNDHASNIFKPIEEICEYMTNLLKEKSHTIVKPGNINLVIAVHVSESKIEGSQKVSPYPIKALRLYIKVAKSNVIWEPVVDRVEMRKHMTKMLTKEALIVDLKKGEIQTQLPRGENTVRMMARKKWHDKWCYMRPPNGTTRCTSHRQHEIQNSQLRENFEQEGVMPPLIENFDHSHQGI